MVKGARCDSANARDTMAFALILLSLAMVVPSASDVYSDSLDDSASIDSEYTVPSDGEEGSSRSEGCTSDEESSGGFMPRSSDEIAFEFKFDFELLQVRGRADRERERHAYADPRALILSPPWSRQWRMPRTTKGVWLR